MDIDFNELDDAALQKLKSRVDGLAEARRAKISVESIKTGMTPQHAEAVRREITRVLAQE